MKLTLPIKVPQGFKPKISQPYANTSNNAWYQAQGITAPFHNGVDLILDPENPKMTYGSALITPSEGWKIVKTTFDTPLSTKGNGLTIESPEFLEEGISKKLQCVYWHCSEIERDKPNQVLPSGTIIGYIGNSGIVFPQPTPARPYCGAHLHLMLFEFHKINNSFVLQNADNGVLGAIDPMTRFSIYNFITGTDTDISKDNPPLLWSFDKLGLKESWQKIVYLFNLFRK